MKTEYKQTNGKGAIEFIKMGMDIRETDYNGDIGNHRIRAYLNYNGVDFLIEARSCRTVRTTNNRTGAPLKKHIQTSTSNGIVIEIYAMQTEVLKGCCGHYFLHETEKQIAHFCTLTEHNKTRHTKKYLLMRINNALCAEFDEIIIKG